MKNKKGISLIVLIVTIIVIIILAAAVILTVSRNNPVESAREATFKEDVRAFQDELALAISKDYTQKQGQRDYKITESEFDEIKKYIPSFTEKYRGKFVIENDKLVATYELTEKEQNWSQDVQITITGKQPFNPDKWDETAAKKDAFEWNGTTIVGYNAENLAGTTTLRIPSHCTEINPDYTYHPDGVRELVSLIEKVEIPETCTKIGKGAFVNFDALTEVDMPDTVTEIGDYAFNSCNELTTINIPSSLVSIGEEAFRYCNKLAIDLTLPEGFTSIGKHAFAECKSLTSVTIPGTLTNMGDYAFYWCENITSVTIKDGVTNIPERAFYWCSNLENLNIANTVTTIGKSSFGGGNKLSTLTLPNNITSIGEYAFADAKNLSNATIPESVTNMGGYVFCGCADNMTINCRVESKPSDWHSAWHCIYDPLFGEQKFATVNWGYKGE